ncbi:MAG: hypothetical protein M1837_002425 [Sclerophora amabilis]|nr:MAG: hypothetical protein M1837_002425 [Sclerophora amabilis]
MSGPSLGQKSRTSLSSQYSITSSTTLASQSSPANQTTSSNEDTTPSVHRNSHDSLGNRLTSAEGSREDNRVQSRGDSRDRYEHNSPERRRPRNSGGFLLDPSFASGSDFRESGQRGEGFDKSGQDRKGKRSTNYTHEILSGRRSIRRRHGSKQSTHIGSSPLSTVVTDSHAGNPDGDGGLVDRLDDSQNAQDTSGVGKASPSQSTSAQGGQVTHHTQSPAQPSSLETDPAQIVRLALNLSDSRRTRAHVPRRDISSSAIESRQVSSSSIPGSTARSRDHVPIGGSLKHHLQQQRRASRNSLKSSSFSPNPAPGSSPAHVAAVEGQETVLSHPFTNDGVDVPYKFSSSTLARAEMARTTLELSVEYRRLLQYLPPLTPLADSLDHSTSAGPGSSDMPNSRPASLRDDASTMRTFKSRQYNPLQCIRNRKVRAREKKTINPEADGWNNLSLVTDWINQIGERSTQWSSQPTDHFSLPPFPRLEDESTQMLSSSTSRPNVTRMDARAARPRNDWLLSPAELLADILWLEQRGHREIIEDRHGRKLYPHGIAPYPDHPRASTEQSNQRSTEKGKRNPDGVLESSGSASKLKDLFSSSENFDDNGSVRGRRHHIIPDTIHRRDDDQAALLKQLPWSKRRGRSLSISSSGSTNSDSYHRDKRRNKKRTESVNGAASALERHMSDLLKREAKGDFESTTVGDQELLNSPQGSPESTKEEHSVRNEPSGLRRPFRYLTKQDHESSQSMKGSVVDVPSSRRESFSNDPDGNARISLDGLDSTAPSSPQFDAARRFSDATNGFVPSIHNGPTPPRSRHASPNRKLNRGLLSKHPLVKSDTNRGRDAISKSDCAIEDDDRPSKWHGLDTVRRNRSSLEEKRASSPVKKPLSRRNEGNNVKEEMNSQTKTPKSSKDTGETEQTRFRGFFKGSRLEEILKSEVSRVGDLFWKRDGQASASNLSSPGLSVTAESSDSDDHDHTDDGGEMISRSTTNSAQPRRYIGDLPTFTSQNDRGDKSQPSMASQDYDHITRQQLARKASGRSPRFEKLAPPRIDMRSVSPSSLPDLSRDDTKESTESALDSRRGSHALGVRSTVSPYQSLESVQDADSKLNAILGLPGHIARQGPPVTGLANVSASDRRESPIRPGLTGKRQWSISDHTSTIPSAPVCKKELARVQALLLSSGVKAKEIARNGAEVKNLPRSWQEFAPEGSLSPAPRSQQHIYFGQILVRRVEDITQRSNEAATGFKRSTVAGLLDQVAVIRDHISSELTPMVRQSADDADELSRDLTTKHTLEVKQLNDSVEMMMRRRRRRLRWLRRSAFILLEWILLSVMWWVWLIVVIIRLVRGILNGVIGGVRWLFWL